LKRAWAIVVGCIVAGLSLAAPARAQDRPATVPTRDVDVTYRMGTPEPGGLPMAQRMRWSVTAAKLRVDPPTPGLYMIVDYRAHRMAVVKTAERAVLDAAAPAAGLPGQSGASYTRQGADSVAGLGCTNWDTADTSGRIATVCMTEDGVLLRASQAGVLLLEAVAVAYVPQDPAAFLPPDGFRHVAPRS